MDFSMTDEQELLLESIDEFFAQHPEFDEAYIKNAEANTEPISEFRAALNEAGIGLMGIPEEYGGTPVDTVTLCMAAERIGYHGFPSGAGTMLQVDDVLHFGTPEQQKNIIECIVGSNVSHMAFCLGLSEPGSGSDSNAIATSYKRRDDGKIVINGSKTFTTDADRSKYMLCMTRDFECGLPPQQSMTVFLVPMDAEGVSMSPLHKVGHRTRTLYEVFLNDVVVDESDIVGKEHEGFMVIMKNFEVERLVLAADSLGMAECAYDDAVKHAAMREQFGKPIGYNQLIQEKIVRMRIRIENMRNLIYKTAWEKDEGKSLRVSANLTKLYAAQAAFEVCDDAMQILGGLGYTDESRVSRLWRDARMHRIGGGTDEIMIYIAGRALLKEGLS